MSFCQSLLTLCCPDRGRFDTVTRPVRDATGTRMVTTRVRRPLARGEDRSRFNMTVWPVNRMTGKRSELGASKPFPAFARLGRFSTDPRLQHAVWAAVGTAEFEYRPAAQKQAALLGPEQQQERPSCPARMHLVLAHKCTRPLLHFCGAKASAAVLRCDQWPCVRPKRSTATFLVLVPAHPQEGMANEEKPPVTLRPMFDELPEGGDGRSASSGWGFGPRAPRPL